jgi:hypothetical protein
MSKPSLIMKPITCALAVILAGLGTVTARADNRISLGVAVNVGPFGSPHYAPSVPAYCPAPAHPPVSARGYWDDITVKSWVPDRWVIGHDRWGRPVRVLERGYFTYRTERVWVETNRHGVAAFGDRRHG